MRAGRGDRLEGAEQSSHGLDVSLYVRVVGRQQYVIASLRDCSDNSRPSTLACSKKPLCVGSEKLEKQRRIGLADLFTKLPGHQAISRRLATYSRKNKLYFAFRELGRVVQTSFLLLDYISDIELPTNDSSGNE